MPGERQLAARRENSDVCGGYRRIVRRKEEDGLGVVHLAGGLLHQLRRQPTCVEEDAELVALQRVGSEDVRDEELPYVFRSVIWVGGPQLEFRYAHAVSLTTWPRAAESQSPAHWPDLRAAANFAYSATTFAPDLPEMPMREV